MYEESFKMPFLIKHPRIIEALDMTDAMVMNVDFAPTLNTALAYKFQQICRRSFKRVFEGKKKK